METETFSLIIWGCAPFQRMFWFCIRHFVKMSSVTAVTREHWILSNNCVSTKQKWKIISETCSAYFEHWIEFIFRHLMTTFSRKTWVILATRCRQDLRPKHDAICWPSGQVTHFVKKSIYFEHIFAKISGVLGD